MASRKYSKTQKTGGSKKSPSTDGTKKRKSRGQARFHLLTDAKRAAESYTAQAEREAEKAGKRSLWSSVGGILGGIAIPMMLGPGGWIAAAAMAGGGAYFGGRAGRQLAESGVGGDARRKDIKVDKFYDKKAKAANLEFKQFDRDIESNLRKQALITGATAGIAKSGIIGKATDKFISTFLPGEPMAGQVGGAGFDIPLLGKEDIGWKQGMKDFKIPPFSGGESAGAEVASTVGEGAKFTETKGAFYTKPMTAVSDPMKHPLAQYENMATAPATELATTLPKNLPGFRDKAGWLSDLPGAAGYESLSASDQVFGAMSDKNLWSKYGKPLGQMMGRVSAETLISQALNQDDDKKLYDPLDQRSLYSYYNV